MKPLSYIMCMYTTFTNSGLIVYDLKSVGPLKFKLVAPMPEQLKTTEIHFYEVSRKPYCCGPDLFWDGCNEIQILGP